MVFFLSYVLSSKLNVLKKFLVYTNLQEFKRYLVAKKVMLNNDAH